MRGSVTKQCSCPTQYDDNGHRKSCSKRHGSWSYVLDIGPDPATGKRRQLRGRGFPTQAAAQSALAEALTRHQSGQLRYDLNLTVGAYLQRWLAARHDSLRATTLTEYRRHINVHLAPLIGHIRLRDLRAVDINRMLVALKSGSAAGHPVGDTTARRVHATLRSALSDAVREDLVATNVAKAATVPRRPPTKVDPWQPKELGTFLDALGDDPYAAYFETVALTGMRRGEAAGLRWRDLDLEKGVVVVRQQVVSMNGRCPTCGEEHKGVTFGPPKTASNTSRRIELGSAAVEVLLAHQANQQADRRALGEAYADHDLVFCRADGNPIPPTRFTATFARLAKQAGLRHARLHDLRHARASLLLASGTDISMVSKMMGHSSVSITADTYSHLMEGVGRKAAEAADALIPRKPRDQSVTSGPANEE